MPSRRYDIVHFYYSMRSAGLCVVNMAIAERRFRSVAAILLWATAAVFIVAIKTATAQNAQFPANPNMATGVYPPAGGSFVPGRSNPWLQTGPPNGSIPVAGPAVFPPGVGAQNWPAPTTAFPNSTLAAPPVNGTIYPNGSGLASPSVTARPNPTSPLFGPSFTTASPTYNLNLPPASPYQGAPSIVPNAFPGTAYASGQPILPNSYPASVYPNSAPPALFPGIFGNSQPSPPVAGWSPSYGQPSGPFTGNPNWTGGTWNQPTWNSGASLFPYNNGTSPFLSDPFGYTSRFLVTPRLRHSYIDGNNSPDSLSINDTEASLLFQVPQFLRSTQPLAIAPFFGLHLWDGPRNGIADLPSKAYSTGLDFAWETNPNQTFSLETGVRVGVFSDFDTFNGDSLRILGKILGRVRLTPNAVGRVGAFWLDRNRIKLLPAAGILWTPNADTRFDLFFPEPKLSHYLSTLGNTDVWWYVTGQYGGGAWTIQRADGSSDNIDINDVRILLGVEWGRNDMIRAGQRTGFVEGGYSFSRELIYRIRPQDNLSLDNSFVVRAGFAY